MYSYINTLFHTHSHSFTHFHTNTATHSHSFTHFHTNTVAHSHPFCTVTHSLLGTLTHNHLHIHTLSHIHSPLHTPTQTLLCTPVYTVTNSHSFEQLHTLPHTLTLLFTPAHTVTHSHSFEQLHTRPHTLTLLCTPVHTVTHSHSFSQLYTLTLLRTSAHTVTHSFVHLNTQKLTSHWGHSPTFCPSESFLVVFPQDIYLYHDVPNHQQDVWVCVTYLVNTRKPRLVFRASMCICKHPASLPKWLEFFYSQIPDTTGSPSAV